jgi:hypothetical protein
MTQQTPTTPQPDPQPKKTKSKAETTYAGKLGDWQRILAPLAANAADLPHLEMPRAQLATLVTQTLEFKSQQDTQRAAKQSASKQLQSMIEEGQRLTALLRQAVKQHYGPRSEKLAEFGIQPFRGRNRAGKTTTPTPTPPPTVELKAPADPTNHS